MGSDDGDEDDHGPGMTKEQKQGMGEWEARTKATATRRRVSGKNCGWDIRRQLTKSVAHFASARGLSAAQFATMVSLGLPIAFMNLLAFVNLHLQPQTQRPSFCAEIFAGQGLVAEQWEKRGYQSFTFERQADRVNEDFCSAEGFATCMFQLLSLSRAGDALTWFGTVCSTWIWLCRATTLRHQSNGYRGDVGKACVRLGNQMIARQSLFIILCGILNIHWCWEHPQSTVARKTAWMKVVQQIRDIMKVHTWQGMFDGPTMKPTFLFSWSQFHAKMKRTMPRDEATSGRWDSTEGVTHLPPSPSGRLRVSGNPQLKRSQRYPEQFCGEIYNSFTDRSNDDHAQLDLQMPDDPDGPVDWDGWLRQRKEWTDVLGVTWSDALLDDACAALGVPAMAPV